MSIKHRQTMTPERSKAAIQYAAESITAAMAQGLNQQESFNRGVVELVDRVLALVERYDAREREALKPWGPGSWRDPTAKESDRSEIIRAAQERLLATGFESLGEAAPFIGGDATAMQYSELLTSTLDPYTLAKLAINTHRKNFTNAKKREQPLPEGYDRGGADTTMHEAAHEQLVASLTDLERSLLSLRLQGYSFREIEEGTAQSGWKVDRREVAAIWRGIEKGVAGGGFCPEPPAARYTKDMTRVRGTETALRANPIPEGYDPYDGETEWGTPDPAEIAQRYREVTLDRVLRRTLRPATAEELKEVRAAAAKVDARVGSKPSREDKRARVAQGELTAHYTLLAQIDRDRKSFGKVTQAVLPPLVDGREGA